MCLPKEIGGLNFRDLEVFNKALVAKQVWRCLQNPNLLASCVMQSKYFPDSNILDADNEAKSSYLVIFFLIYLCSVTRVTRDFVILSYKF